jgi:hypothetical protein
MSRHTHRATPNLRNAVAAMARGGISDELIAHALGVGLTTLRKLYMADLKGGRGHVEAGGKPQLSLLLAPGGNPAVVAQIFRARARARAIQEQPPIEEHVDPLTAVLREIDGHTRGLPSQDQRPARREGPRHVQDMPDKEVLLRVFVGRHGRLPAPGESIDLTDEELEAGIRKA